MKTTELVSTLADSVGLAEFSDVIRRTFAWATLAGFLFAGGVAIGVLGLRADLLTIHAAAFICLKAGFAGTILGLATFYLARIARPGGEHRVSNIVMISPFAAMLALSATILVLAPISQWDRLVFGEEWIKCLLSIPLIAIGPFAAVVWAARRAAPTDLTMGGAFAGLVAGISALAYTLHCTYDSLPFVAVWYGGTIALCTIAGAILGPRLLRW